MYHAPMDEGRKRVLAIVAGILVARHLKTTQDLFDNRSSPRTESMVAAAVQWAERPCERLTTYSRQVAEPPASAPNALTREGYSLLLTDTLNHPGHNIRHL
jgi:hypothetical protein